MWSDMVGFKANDPTKPANVFVIRFLGAGSAGFYLCCRYR